MCPKRGLSSNFQGTANTILLTGAAAVIIQSVNSAVQGLPISQVAEDLHGMPYTVYSP